MNTATPTFDRRDRGTSEGRWRSAGIFERASPPDLAGVRRLVVLCAHPDDEALGAAGLIRRLHSLGADVDMRWPPTRRRIPARPRIRRSGSPRCVARRCVGHRGHLAPPARLRRLGLPDGDLAAHHDVLTGALRSTIGRAASGTFLAAPWHDDSHPDHEAVARAVERVARETGAIAIEFPIWAWLWAGAEDPRLDPVG